MRLHILGFLPLFPRKARSESNAFFTVFHKENGSFTSPYFSFYRRPNPRNQSLPCSFSSYTALGGKIINSNCKMIPAYINVNRAHVPLETKSRQETLHTNLLKYISTVRKREESHKSGNSKWQMKVSCSLDLPVSLFLWLFTNYRNINYFLSFWINEIEVCYFMIQFWSTKKVNRVL